MSTGTFTYSTTAAPPWEVGTTLGTLPLNVNQPPSILRKLAELFLYIPVLMSAFLGIWGLHQVRFLGGGVSFVSTVLTFVFVLIAGSRLPLSVWFAILICFGANLSQSIGNGESPVIGAGLPMLLFHVGTLLGTWFVIQNRAGELRVIIFYAILMIVLTFMGGAFMKTTASVERLELEGVGGLMANPNSIAYMTGMIAVAMLFMSLRVTPILKVLLWILALAMFVLLVRTVSRTGLVLFAVGIMAFAVTVLAGRGMRVSGLIFMCVAILFASQFAYLVVDYLVFFQQRARVDTQSRLAIFSFATLQDMMSTFIFGRGPDDAIATATGIAPHNTFVYIHLGYGGITAYPYLLWLTILGVRVLRMLRAKDHPLDIKAFVLAVFLMAVGGEASNNINFTLYSSAYAWAVIEKYTASYSRRNMELRAGESAYLMPAVQVSPPIRLPRRPHGHGWQASR